MSTRKMQPPRDRRPTHGRWLRARVQSGLSHEGMSWIGRVLPGLCICMALVPPASLAQLAFQGSRQGETYKVYIFRKVSAGPGRWRFQTKAVYASGAEPYFSEWQVADCYNATIDGKVVPAVARYGYEEGLPDVFKAVCSLR